jgi:hypothetical protein
MLAESDNSLSSVGLLRQASAILARQRTAAWTVNSEVLQVWSKLVQIVLSGNASIKATLRTRAGSMTALKRIAERLRLLRGRRQF